MSEQIQKPHAASVSQAVPASSRERITPDHPLMRQLLARYIAGLPAQVSELEASSKQADLERLRRLTHQLKGSGGSYGFAKITQLAAAAEGSIMQGESLRQIRGKLQKLIEFVRGIPGYEVDQENQQRAAA